MDYRFGNSQCRSVQFVDDVAGSIAGENWELNVIDGEQIDPLTQEWVEVKYVPWLDNGVAAAPVVAADQTLLPIPLTNNDTAETIALAYETALAALPVKVLVTGDLVEVQNHFLGAITVEDNSGAPSLTFAIGKVGNGGYLGQVAQGGATLAIEETNIDLVSDNTGAVILDQIGIGVTNTLTMTLVEMTTQRWEDLVGNVSGDIVESGPDKIIGWGTSKLYQSKFALGGRLVGHPVRLPLTDRSADISMFTAPTLSSITFSGQEAQGAEVEFVALENRGVSNKVSLARRGDYTLL
jgi:hypothetical protein